MKLEFGPVAEGVDAAQIPRLRRHGRHILALAEEAGLVPRWLAAGNLLFGWERETRMFNQDVKD